MIHTISHDPFARQAVVRRVIQCTKAQGDIGCAECGSINGKGWKLFQYGIARDDRAGADWQSQLFCSIGCKRAFNCE